MNTAITQFRPSSTWITAALLTLFVIAFGIFADSHARTDAPVLLSGEAIVGEFCRTSTLGKTGTLFRYH
jgi:hypothetical protein